MKAICDMCGAEYSTKPAEYKRKKRHFHSRACYAKYMREVQPSERSNAWKGGISNKESVAKWRAKNRDKMAAMARARKNRELDAPGHHTAKEWKEYKIKLGNVCAEKDDTCKGRNSKDHIIPLSMGGSNDLSNLQILCESHNKRKARKVYLGTFVVKS